MVDPKTTALPLGHARKLVVTNVTTKVYYTKLGALSTTFLVAVQDWSKAEFAFDASVG